MYKNVWVTFIPHSLLLCGLTYDGFLLYSVHLTTLFRQVFFLHSAHLTSSFSPSLEGESWFFFWKSPVGSFTSVLL